MKNAYLHYIRITFLKDKYEFSWKNNIYELTPNTHQKITNGFKIDNIDDKGSVDKDLLEWLSIYFSEDLVTPNKVDRSDYSHIRGYQKFNHEHFESFLKIVEKFTIKNQPKWRKNAFRRVLQFHISSLRLGIEEFPVNISLIATSIELLSNIYDKKQSSNYQTIGAKPMNRILNREFYIHILNRSDRSVKRIFKSHIEKEFLLLIYIRNLLGSHSIIHQPDNKKLLVEALRDWFKQGGHTVTRSNEIKQYNLEDKLITYSPSIYKMAIRLSRILIFCHIGMGDDINTSTHDWGIWGTFPENWVKNK